MDVQGSHPPRSVGRLSLSEQGLRLHESEGPRAREETVVGREEPLWDDGPLGQQRAARHAARIFDLRTMTQALISQFLIGISVGAILVISAVGLAVIFGVAGVINMAHGQFIMVGAYAAAVVGQFGGNTFIAIPVAFVVVALLGLIVERGIIQWIYDRPLETLLATWGVGIILEVLMKVIFGPELYYVGAPRILDGGLRIIGRLPYPYYRLFLIGMAILMVLATFYIIYKTPFGLKVRAVRRNRAMSGCLGIDTARVD